MNIYIKKIIKLKQIINKYKKSNTKQRIIICCLKYNSYKNNFYIAIEK